MPGHGFACGALLRTSPGCTRAPTSPVRMGSGGVSAPYAVGIGPFRPRRVLGGSPGTCHGAETVPPPIPFLNHGARTNAGTRLRPRDTTAAARAAALQ